MKCKKKSRTETASESFSDNILEFLCFWSASSALKNHIKRDQYTYTHKRAMWMLEMPFASKEFFLRLDLWLIYISLHIIWRHVKRHSRKYFVSSDSRANKTRRERKPPVVFINFYLCYHQTLEIDKWMWIVFCAPPRNSKFSEAAFASDDLVCLFVNSGQATF